LTALPGGQTFDRVARREKRLPALSGGETFDRVDRRNTKNKKKRRTGENRR
jgi:hypothetical protein